MADVFTPEKRSKVMSKIKGKDTKPEMIIRKALHGLGYRYTLHKQSLPGKPDLYFKKYNAVIEINGCFWHGHDCSRFKLPKTRRDFWQEKITKNRERDSRNIKKLRKKGLRVLIIWGCAIRGKHSLKLGKLIKRIEEWLNSSHVFCSIEEKN